MAAKSLSLLSEDYVLDLSDISLIHCLLERMTLSPADRARVLELIGQKNAPGIQDRLDRFVQGMEGLFSPKKS